MSSTHLITTWSEPVLAAAAKTHLTNWYAVQTRSRHEKFVSAQLQRGGISHYLPMVTEVHRWSDRKKKVEMPLFSGYVFVQIPSTNEDRVRVLRTDGVVRLVGHGPEGTPIREEEIESVKTLVDQGVPWITHPFLQAGQRIRIRGGALDGLEGIFQSQSGQDMLIVSINAIQRSLSVSLRGYEIEVI